MPDTPSTADSVFRLDLWKLIEDGQIIPMNAPSMSADAQAIMTFQTHRKEMLVAYLLWWFLGPFGGHRFYMGHTSSAVIMLVISIVSVPLMFLLIGFATWGAVIVWWLVDAFLIPEWVTGHNEALMQHIQYQQSLPQLPSHQSPWAPVTTEDQPESGSSH